MKERGILFSAPMVRALLDGTKTQTRRVADTGPYAIDARIHGAGTAVGELAALVTTCPYGQPGDRLWVRETFFAYGRWETRTNQKKAREERYFVDMTCESGLAHQYAADKPDLPLVKGRGPTPGWYTRSALFMPRVASRILLEVVGVRVERLHELSDQDAIAEGIGLDEKAIGVPLAGTGETIAYGRYRALWEEINGAGSWAANPWIWVVEFKRIETAGSRPAPSRAP
jgi:hypothetical protein